MIEHVRFIIFARILLKFTKSITSLPLLYRYVYFLYCKICKSKMLSFLISDRHHHNEECCHVVSEEVVLSDGADEGYKSHTQAVAGDAIGLFYHVFYMQREKKNTFLNACVFPPSARISVHIPSFGGSPWCIQSMQ